MRIYEFSHDEHTQDWVLAPSKKEAKKFYLGFTDCGDLTGIIVKKIPKKKWSEMYILNPDNVEPDEDDENYNEENYCGGYEIIESFAEYALRNTKTDMIATTEF